MIRNLKEKRRKYILSKALPKYKKIFELLPRKGKILDAGCGKANLSKYILSQNKSLKIIGCDTGKTSDLKNKSFKYVQKDLDEGFKFNEKFDVIIFADVIEHLKEPMKILKEAMKHSNKFIISIPNLDFFMYRLYPKLENPPKGESQHLHHWKPKEFLKILPKELKLIKKDYCTDFPEFRWANKLFPKSSFFNQTLILELIKHE